MSHEAAHALSRTLPNANFAHCELLEHVRNGSEAAIRLNPPSGLIGDVIRT
jgi:hypothetical protein